MLVPHALVVTDVVDSTRLVEALGDAGAATLWAAHDRVARDLLRVHGGREIDKTDGFLLLFDRVEDAVRYTVAYHREIARLDPPLKARAGVHVGDVILTANRSADVALGAKPLEVDGIAKPVTARVMSVAVGGQTLLTPAARDVLPTGDYQVVSHGHWRMKGLDEPIELFEAGGPDAPFVRPPDGAKVYRVVSSGGLWVPVAHVRHNLPAERDPFVGRTTDLAALARRLEEGARLVAVLGTGGTGKTRFALRFAWSWLGDWPGGTWFCDLSEARSADGLVEAVARALEVPLGGSDPTAQLGHAIRGRGRCLVVLDNLEQIARHATGTVGRWLDIAAEAQFVVTTREVLGIPGEHVVALPPLPLVDGVALFVARARAASRDFAPGEGDTACIEELVRLLDGLPLAIELAAARVRVMRPAVLVERMGERFRLLSSGSGRRDRQATLRSTIDWSWDLLSAEECLALAQLSVFEGTWTLDGAEAVLDAGRDAWAVDLVQALVDRSLVRRADGERFDLLVTVQEYAAEKLDATGTRPATEARHGRFFAGHGTADALAALDGADGAGRRRRLALDADNLVSAAQRAVARRDASVAAATARAAWAVLSVRGPFARAVELLRGAAAVPGVDGPAHVALGLALARALAAAGRPAEAEAEAAEALLRSRALGDDASADHAALEHASLASARGRIDQAEALASDVLGRARARGDARIEGMALTCLGRIAAARGRWDEAGVRFEGALAIARLLCDRSKEGALLGNLGVVAARLRRPSDARPAYEAAVAIAVEVGDAHGEGASLVNLGLLLVKEGRVEEGRAAYERSLRVFREMGHRRDQFGVLVNLALVDAELGLHPSARRGYDEALSIAVDLGFRHGEVVVLANLAIVDRAEGRPADALVRLDRALAICIEVGDARSEAEVREGLAEAYRMSDRTQEARSMWTEAARLLSDLDRPRYAVVVARGAELSADAGEADRALAAIDEAERIVRPVDARSELAQVLSARAQVALTLGDRAAAERALGEAEALAAPTRPFSDVGRALAAARARLERWPSSPD